MSTSSTQSKKRSSALNDETKGESQLSKKSKTTSVTTKAKPQQQSSLVSFFGKKAATTQNPKKELNAESKSERKSKHKEEQGKEPLKETTQNKVASSIFGRKSSQNVKQESPQANDKTSSSNDQDSFDPIVPIKVPPANNATWRVLQNTLLLRTVSKQPPRTKIAAFDLDGTILVWRTAGWPSAFTHYELWNPAVITKMRHLYDKDNCKLVIFSNQGGIRKAFTGKTATLRKALVEWLAHLIDRPLVCVMSTDKKGGFHKPNPGMWTIMEKYANGGQAIALDDLEGCFYVGDSVGEHDAQGGVDDKFAQNVSLMIKQEQLDEGATTVKTENTLKFYEPQDYFGPSNADKRKSKGMMDNYETPPKQALRIRAALSGRYFEKAPLLLMLAGVQGSGKSTFCTKLLNRSSKNNNSNKNAPQNERHVQAQATWVHLSQDSINKGKPGKREQVENAARQALQRNQSVIIDRMHLDSEQRSHFIILAKEEQVQVHIIWLDFSKDVISSRVMKRTNHPGKVEGEKGAKMAVAALGRMSPPRYEEGFDLVSRTGTMGGMDRLCELYCGVGCDKNEGKDGGNDENSQDFVSRLGPSLPRNITLADGVIMPSVILGTMNIGKRQIPSVIHQALELGWKAIDTAPTYKNETEIGQTLNKHSKDKDDVFCICKVPMRAIQPAQVLEEVQSSLANLQRSSCNLLLLHWPANVVEASTLPAIWQAMEECHNQGLCLALGVCNFNINALRMLLPHCQRVRPVVNQVERHLLLPQWELLEFCSWQQDIVVMAHTPLGQGQKDIVEHEIVTRVKKEEETKCRDLSAAQIMLQWNLSHGCAVVPKCSSEEHMKEVINDDSILGCGDQEDEEKGKEENVSPPTALQVPAKLTPWTMKVLDEETTQGAVKRFVAPPFMYKPSAVYAWGDRPPKTAGPVKVK